MAGREKMKLTDAVIARLRPREREYTVWDARVAGLGVRVRPSGGRSWVLLLDVGGRSKRVSLGAVDLKRVEEARRECHAHRAREEPELRIGPPPPAPLFRDFVAGPWKHAHFDTYKSSTKRGVRHQLTAQLLPAFGTKPLDRIKEAGIRYWFGRYSQTAPGNANLALARLRQILNFAIACGHMESNPAAGIAFNPRPPLTRFLSREELTRLHAALDRPCRPETRQTAGRHHPPSAIHRLPKERDYRPRLVGSARRQACPGRQQDGIEGSAAQQPGPSRSRRAAAHRQPVRVSLPARSLPPAHS